MNWLSHPWPWYVAGPLIGLMVPTMLFIGNRSFGISNNLRHLCAITQPQQVDVDFFRYDWKEHTWSLMFVIGTVLGGYLAGVVFANPDPVALTQAARDMLLSWGFLLPSGALVPDEARAGGTAFSEPGADAAPDGNLRDGAGGDAAA